MISTAQAFVLRRVALGAAALASTLAAHAVATGHLGLMPAAPALWGWLLLACAIVGRRRSRWRRRRPAEILALLLAAQLVLHVAMGVAPWAFGLHVHHAQPLVTPAAVAAHLVAAVVLAGLLTRLERLLAGALAAIDAVRAALAPAGRGVAPSRVLRLALPRPPASPARRAASARGPPLLSV